MKKKIWKHYNKNRISWRLFLQLLAVFCASNRFPGGLGTAPKACAMSAIAGGFLNRWYNRHELYAAPFGVCPRF